MEISVDKLPVKRLDAIEENGVERYPPDVDLDEKRQSLIRRIDFAFAVENNDEEKKKKKKSKSKGTNTTSSSSSQPPHLQWQPMIENLQLAHQELSIIIDLINTVEANDAVTVAGLTRPKLLPQEAMSDLAVCTATKLQCYKHLGKYFKQSAKALEQQVAREARFYGALIRLQQNWKVKRQRVAAAAGSEGFTIDLFDDSMYDSGSIFRSGALSTIRMEHDTAGMLAINLPPSSCRSIRFGFLGVHASDASKELSKNKPSGLAKEPCRQPEKEQLVNDDEKIKLTNSLLREVHEAIFDEQVFDIVNREAFNKSVGVNVSGIRENYLQLSIGQGTSVFISLVPSVADAQKVDFEDSQNLESAVVPMDFYDGVKSEDVPKTFNKKSTFPSRLCYEIYLQQIFHEQMLAKAKAKPTSTGPQVPNHAIKDGPGLLGHFCLSLAHRIFSNKVLMELENVVCGVSYLHLISRPTWQSRMSSLTIFMEIPQSILHAVSQPQTSEINGMKNVSKSQFRTKVLINDDCITVEAEGSSNIVGQFKGSSEDLCSVNKYECSLADLPVIVLQQVASQIISWLHEEALIVGIKPNRDFLCLSFELDQGETLSLVAHVDPEDTQGCISWWLIMEDGFAEEQKIHGDISDGASKYRKFLGHLSLEILYSTLMDLVSMCCGGV